MFGLIGEPVVVPLLLPVFLLDRGKSLVVEKTNKLLHVRITEICSAAGRGMVRRERLREDRVGFIWLVHGLPPGFQDLQRWLHRREARRTVCEAFGQSWQGSRRNSNRPFCEESRDRPEQLPKKRTLFRRRADLLACCQAK